MKLIFGDLSSISATSKEGLAYAKMQKRTGVSLCSHDGVAVYQSKHYTVVGIVTADADIVLGIAKKEDVDVFDAFHGLCIAWGKALRNYRRWEL